MTAQRGECPAKTSSVNVTILGRPVSANTTGKGFWRCAAFLKSANARALKHARGRVFVRSLAGEGPSGATGHYEHHDTGDAESGIAVFGKL